MVDLWYDWPNGRNLNIEQDQLAQLPLYNVEWTNGTSFFFRQAEDPYCQIASFEVGILRPNWMDGANYLGQRHMDGFLCNVWEKADGFIWYYEDSLSKRPVYWLLFSGLVTCQSAMVWSLVNLPCIKRYVDVGRPLVSGIRFVACNQESKANFRTLRKSEDIIT